MTTSERRMSSMPTSTAHQARLSLYQPTRRPQHTEQQIVTSWGRVRVVGRLGQQHADVVEAMFSTAEGRGVDEVGRIKLLVDPARVRVSARQTSGTTMRRVLDDIMSAVIEIKEPDHLRCIGHLIDHVDIATRSDGSRVTRPNPLDGGEREMWRVTIGQAAMHMLGADLHLRYDPAPIAALRHGVSQAVARLVLTHNSARQPNGGWMLDTLLRQVGGDLTGAVLRDRRREVRADAEALAEVGIILSGDGERVSVEHKHGARPQNRGSVEHKHGGVEHKHGETAKRGA